ncbi:hypothetical protein AAMO2058_000504000 [Amorphochlora amoebiformis]|uniref:Acyltransferase 3 domain-containing protein n=1 Tax=Amorphochlora amoebiformis TaxID=1561963 RepID=A0A7S0DNK3_9EUKA|mmetsp:Transcript_34579/g.55740  ORF Transcript_34579/g.55740 Transcript_34579/m.55740 type:complete len:474 (+) Transcript_34579:73-1494(+)
MWKMYQTLWTRPKNRNGDSFAALDGVRAISHLSIVALHSSMISTAHLPGQGPVWDAVRLSPFHSIMQAGGIQVDVFFVLSGFLLTISLVNQLRVGKEISVFGQALRRMWRMMPLIIAATVFGSLVGEDWDPGYIGIYSTILLYNNLLDPFRVGSFTLTLCWSCCVDFQAGIIVTLIVLAAHSRMVKDFLRMDPITLVKYTALFVSMGTCAIRYVRYDPVKANTIKLAQINHFGRMMSDGGFSWIQNRYNHTWRTPNDARDTAHYYLEQLYLPTIPRMGPIFIGVVAACNYIHAKEWSKTRESNPSASTIWIIASTLGKWISIFWAFIQLFTPMIPSDPDNAPDAVGLFVTVALRVLSSMAAAILIFSAVVPSSHPWHLGWLGRFLGWDIWLPISKISFASYLIHFKILMEAILRIPPPFVSSPADTPYYFAYVCVMNGVGLAISFTIATGLHLFVEQPAIRAFKSAKPSKKTV